MSEVEIGGNEEVKQEVLSLWVGRRDSHSSVGLAVSVIVKNTTCIFTLYFWEEKYKIWLLFQFAKTSKLTVPCFANPTISPSNQSYKNSKYLETNKLCVEVLPLSRCCNVNQLYYINTRIRLVTTI